MENNQNETFQYSYSAKQQEEIQRIRQKYQLKEQDKLEQLHRLDASVTRKGSTAALIVGILSCLVLGTGMSCVMEWGKEWFVAGIVIGVIGLMGVMAAYPLYTYVVKKERARLAPEILRLTEELLK